MKKICYALISCLLLFSCKGDKAAQAATEAGYVIRGKMDGVPPSSVAVLTYKIKDSTVTDTAVITQGAFSFEGKVSWVAPANIYVRHGEHFPENSWERDGITFYMENTAMTITASDSIKKAAIQGSILNEEAAEFSAAVNPLRRKIRTLSLDLQGKPQDSAYMATVDTIKATGDRALAYVRKFIEDHRSSYMALQAFADYELGYNFDPVVAEQEFSLFDENLRISPLGERVGNTITLSKNTSVGQLAMDFSLPTVTGESFSLAALRGQYVLIDFWASWCVPCRVENPHLVKAYKAYRDKNFEIVGVSLDEKRKNWENAIEKDGLPWIHVSDLKGNNNEVAIQYGITAIPQNFLLDPDGVIIAKNLKGEDVIAKLSDLFETQ